ncbi:MAG TPA: IS30 family transposase [Terriglobales bacterium]|nr:IS30 family transposase [Terriglobales bacterium]
MRQYSQLSLQERYTLATLKARGVSIPFIAGALGRHPSTLYRELSRNVRPSGRYAAFVGHSYATARNHRCHRGSRYSQEQWNLVFDLLYQEWSPEQISAVLRQQGSLVISAATIYRMIKKDRRRGGEIFKVLRIYPKRRRKRYRSEDYRGRLKGKRPISERPPGANDRSEFGHWEADTVMGADKFECVLTVVERQTGYAQLAKIRHRTAREVTAALGRIIAVQPELFKTITFDNGTEFHSYKRLERRFLVTCYFAAPHHPWERGSNENFNGLLRQYLPKGTSMAYIGDRKLEGFCHRLNTRPRKRHGFKSPQEVLYGSTPVSHLVV